MTSKKRLVPSRRNNALACLHAAREYLGLLKHYGVALSIPQHGAPYENAVAERVKGILKNEFSLCTALSGFAQVDALLVQTVRVYYKLHPHGNCDFLTPSQAHKQE